MRETALGLAARGFKVFPIRAGEKSPPLIPAWQDHATTDATTVAGWWTKWPQANVGIHCDGLVVIDVDPKNGGNESLVELKKEIKLEKTYAVRTPSGGTHIYYRSGDILVRNAVHALGRGIDVRTTAGYVVGAGSRTAAGAYVAVLDAPLARVSDAVVAKLGARKAERKEQAPPVETYVETAMARAFSFLETHPVAVQGQGGDHHTYSTICRVRDFGVPQERAAEALADWNARCCPAWDGGELETKIANAYTYAQDPAGMLTAEAMGFEIIPGSESQGEPQEQSEQQSEQSEQSQQSAPEEMLHPADVVHDDVLRSQYLIKKVLDKQSNAMLFGKWNVGKTFVVLDMAACIACGLPWFGQRVTQGKVLYLGYEGVRAMKKRMIALRGKYPQLKDKKVPFRWAAMRGAITEDAGFAELKRLIKLFKSLHGGAPDLVIIDPLMNAITGDDSDAKEMGTLNRRVASVMRTEKCTVLRVHHVGHGAGDRARGHSSLPAGVDTNIRVDGDHIAMTKQRDDVLKAFDYTLNEVPVGIDQDGEAVTTMVVEHIEDNPASGKLTRTPRLVMDALILRYGDGKNVAATAINDCCPEEMHAEEKRRLRDTLVKKQYLIPDGKEFTINAAGPAPQFNG